MKVSDSSTGGVHGPLSILIVGAGLGGLSAALAFRKQGHRVTVLEKSQFARETGAAIHLPPNCTALLNWLGLDPREFGGTLLEQFLRYDDKGNLVTCQQFTDLRTKWQAEWYMVHRIDFHNALKAKVMASDGDLEPIPLHKGCQITGVNPEEGSVTLEDGQQMRGDILVGADGIHSMTRKALGSDISPVPTGKACFRWLVPISTFRESVDTADLVKDPGTYLDWRGPRSRLIAYPCSDNTTFNLGGFLPSSEVGLVGTDWQASGNRDTLVQGFKSFPLPARRLTEASDETLKVWNLYDMESLPTYVRGRMALLGDAAHPFTPFMGQGGAMAVEDGVSMATMCPLGTSPSEVNTRLKLFEKARRERIELVLSFTRSAGRDDDDESGDLIKGSQILRVFETLFAHNELAHSTSILKQAIA